MNLSCNNSVQRTELFRSVIKNPVPIITSEYLSFFYHIRIFVSQRNQYGHISANCHGNLNIFSSLTYPVYGLMMPCRAKYCRKKNLTERFLESVVSRDLVDTNEIIRNLTITIYIIIFAQGQVSHSCHFVHLVNVGVSLTFELDRIISYTFWQVQDALYAKFVLPVEFYWL